MLTKIHVEKIHRVFFWSKAALGLDGKVGTHVLFSGTRRNQTLTLWHCRKNEVF